MFSESSRARIRTGRQCRPAVAGRSWKGVLGVPRRDITGAPSGGGSIRQEPQNRDPASIHAPIRLTPGLRLRAPRLVICFCRSHRSSRVATSPLDRHHVTGDPFPTRTSLRSGSIKSGSCGLAHDPVTGVPMQPCAERVPAHVEACLTWHAGDRGASEGISGGCGVDHPHRTGRGHHSVRPAHEINSLSDDTIRHFVTNSTGTATMRVRSSISLRG